MSTTCRTFDLTRQTCGETGKLPIRASGKSDFTFVGVGFVGLALDQH
jgi:hypothetical protein